MLIIHGKKIVRKKAGVLGHFCPICRQVCLFKATNLRQVEHLYFIGIGRGQPVATELQCDSCRTLLGLSYGAGAPEPNATGDLVEFAARTGPLGEGGLLARVDLEARAAAKACTRDERLALIAEPFEMLEYLAQVQRIRGQDESIGAVISLLAIASLVASVIMWFMCFDRVPPSRAFVAWTIGVTIAAILLTTWAITRAIRTRRRVARSRKVLTPLARALRPLQPTQSELEEVLAGFRRKETLLGMGLDPTTILADINKP